MESWTQVTEENLIDSVRALQCIWDVSSKVYKDQRARENAWMEVVQKEGIEREECQRKWKNLRDHFVRELKKTLCITGRQYPILIPWQQKPYD
uniref:MADF domain-containing protein n=1 Tax=Amphimedon queenslandica TaxID=400682 RepID=A0A1X7V7D1_AMPQE